MAGSAASDLQEILARIPNARITATYFQEVYGTMTRFEYPEYTRERALSKVLSRREPGASRYRIRRRLTRMASEIQVVRRCHCVKYGGLASRVRRFDERACD